MTESYTSFIEVYTTIVASVNHYMDNTLADSEYLDVKTSSAVQRSLADFNRLKDTTRQTIISGDASESALETLMKSANSIVEEARKTAHDEGKDMPDFKLVGTEHGAAIFKQLHQDTFSHIFAELAVGFETASSDIEAICNGQKKLMDDVADTFSNAQIQQIDRFHTIWHISTTAQKELNLDNLVGVYRDFENIKSDYLAAWSAAAEEWEKGNEGLAQAESTIAPEHTARDTGGPNLRVVK